MEGLWVNWYSEHRDQWKEIIETVAAEEHRTTLMIEKDTIQSMILLQLSRSDIPFVFKGGTSLSKAFNLIDRFSEDLDLSLNRKPTEQEKRKSNSIILDIAENMNLALANPESVRSKYSYNKYVFEYQSLFSEIPLELIVETNFYQAGYPADVHTVGCFVGKFCEEKGITLPVPFDAAEVSMPVQSMERTFIDKVFAICDYRLQNMQDRDSRHLYDVAKLLTRIRITPELDALVDDVREERMKSKNSPAAQLQYDIPKMLKEIIKSRFYESDYNNITRKLLYDDVTYEEAIKNGIALVADMDIFVYKRK